MMSIRVLFHVLTILSGAAATIYALSSSHNRFVVCTAFILVGVIFQVAILLLKPPLVNPPELVYSIKLLPSNYAEGYDFDGIKWEKDYEEYRLYFCNKSKNVDIRDLRISIDMLGGVVQYKILNQEGCENLSVSLADTIGGGIGNKDKIIRPVKTYSNNLKINSIRVFREGYCSVRLIVKTFSLSDDSEGIFEIRCHYSDADNNMIKKAAAYKILVKDKDKKTVYIDIENPLTGNYYRSMGAIFDKPLVFKKGLVYEEGQEIDESLITGKPIEAYLGDLKFSKEEFEKFKVFIGRDIINLTEGKNLETIEGPAILPRIKLKTEHPDKEYSCFDNIIFKVRRVKDEFIYLDNKDQDRTVVVELIFDPKIEGGNFSRDFIKLNRGAKNYNIDHEIAFYEFKRSLIGNAKLLFVKLDDNSIISRTHNFVPVNIDSSGSLRNMDEAIAYLNTIKSKAEEQ